MKGYISHLLQASEERIFDNCGFVSRFGLAVMR